MKATIKVSHLVMDDDMYCRGDVVDMPESEISRLGSSVDAILPTIDVIDERDAKIAELEDTITTLRDELVTKDSTISGMENEITARQKEIKKLLKGK